MATSAKRAKPAAKPAAKAAAKPAAKAAANAVPSSTLDARPDRLDLRDLPYRPPLRSLPSRWPRDADLKRLLPAYVKAGRILNQGNEGACTGFGLACVTNYLYWLRHLDASTPARTPLPELVSPRMYYELAKLYDEWPGQDYEGSSCRGALKGWHKHGVCTSKHWPYPLDRDGKGVFARPAAGWDEDATRRPLGVYYRVDKKSVVDIQAAIYEIGAVYVSGDVHDGWGLDAGPMPASHDKLPRIEAHAQKTGGHAFALVGYNEYGFVVQNSWGTDWGASGFAILGYEDWVSNGSDCWAVALGVPQDLSDIKRRTAGGAKAAKAARAASGFRVAAGRGLGDVGATLREGDNPRDDPWPVNHVFAHKPYQPLRTAEAYTHTLVSGNDGQLMSTDFTRARSDREGLAREIAVERPLAWFKANAGKSVKLAIYAHGGLNSENESVQRIRVLAPYFLANGIYPLFFTWKTGPGETLGDMLEDLKHRVIGGAERSEGFLDKLREAAAEAKDRAIEAVGRQFARGIWSEMRENAAGGAVDDHVLDLAARMLRELRTALAKDGRTLELHLVGHSAGSILLGHLLDRLGGAGAVQVAGCELYAAACSSGFAVQHYGGADKAGVLSLQNLRLHVLTDGNERADGLPSAEHDVYGKSLLYLVSRALDDVRKQPLLGMERALVEPDAKWVDDQWAGPPNADVAAWLKLWPAGELLQRVDTPKVRTTKAGDQIAASHGSFDNNIEVLSATLQRIRGGALVSEMEWLDY